MRETSFIQQNKEKWSEFETAFSDDSENPEKISNLFIQITDDLSYSRTYYPNRSVKIYLNNLAQKVFFSIYKNRRQRRRKFIFFWKEELPKIMFECRKTLLFTFCLFVLAMGIGIFSSMHDGDFAKLILGDGYVSMTNDNIANGDPMKVYKDAEQTTMFFGIAWNNLQVCFYSFMLGIFFGLGTAVYIMYNGVMVGVFQYFFIERGLFWVSFLTIWMHGALEIPSIILAGTAGIELGKGLLFPGTLSRLQSFRISAVRGMKIIVGIAPIIIIAASIESFLTRYTDTADWVRALFIFLCFGFMAMYYIIYPALKAKKGFAIKDRPDELTADKRPEFTFNKIKNNGEIFAESFLLFRQFFSPIFRFCLLLAALYTTAILFLLYSPDQINHAIPFGDNDIWRAIYVAFYESYKDIKQMTEFNHNMFHFAANGIVLTLLFSIAFYVIYSAINNNLVFSVKKYLSFLFKGILFFALFAFLLHSTQFIEGSTMNFIFFISFPFICLALAGMYADGKISFAGLKIFSVIKTSFLSTAFLYFSLMILSYMFLFLAHSSISYLHTELIKWNIPFNENLYEIITDFSITLLFSLALFLSITLIIINMGLLYFSLKEIKTAANLKFRIAHIGDTKKNTL